ncbi:uncharacterized protein EV420DRAFT_110568 [Desarmillaria tabescens]|uniref:Uncharacterized protein n=1 Tax=Armillaria tabescens TaxID=1929756 RepID=A0AA39NR81_ARMTA|nr:uncharacterized protein EV420DRAFT_110568 [Desarmillaria tabescens]KAK0470377.1 hypothetical protein EV420DRAFT_110568 [Desarmillaria tabescens]
MFWLAMSSGSCSVQLASTTRQRLGNRYDPKIMLRCHLGKAHRRSCPAYHHRGLHTRIPLIDVSSFPLYFIGWPPLYSGTIDHLCS